MKYHEQISKYRNETGCDPICVFIDDYEYADNDRIHELNTPHDYPSVSIAGDFIPALDLRFVYGIKVNGASHEERRAKALFKRVLMFRPSHCIVTVIPPKNDLNGDYWMGVYTKEQGVVCE